MSYLLVNSAAKKRNGLFERSNDIYSYAKGVVTPPTGLTGTPSTGASSEGNIDPNSEISPGIVQPSSTLSLSEGQKPSDAKEIQAEIHIQTAAVLLKNDQEKVDESDTILYKILH